MDETSLRARMQQVVGLVVEDVGGIRTGRATPALIENLTLMLYGGSQKMRLVEVASIGSGDPQTLVVDLWDKSIIGEIKQGILSANIGMNPSIDGEVIRISLPPLTTEDREKYVKLLSVKVENGKVMIRQIRGDEMRAIKQKFEDKQLSEDENFASEKKLQEITDEFIAKIEELGENKKQELLQI